MMVAAGACSSSPGASGGTDAGMDGGGHDAGGQDAKPLEDAKTTDATSHDAKGHDAGGHDAAGHDATGHDAGGHDSEPPSDGGQPEAEAGDHEASTSDAGDSGSPDAAVDAGPPPISSVVTSGSRLEGKWFETPGLSRLESIHDNVLGLDCAWKTAADGALRCLPTNVAYAANKSGLAYSDMNCQTPVYQVYSSDCAPSAGQYVTQGAETCPAGEHVFAIGVTISPPTTTYFLDSMGQCAYPQPPPAGATFYTLTEATPSTFVSGNEVTGSPSDNLAAVTVTGGDGSTTFETLRYTTNSSADCTYATATDNTLRCLPSTDAAPDPGEFSDINCSVPAVTGATMSCTSIPFATTTPLSGCPLAKTVYDVGALTPTLYKVFADGCSADSVNGPTFFALGGVVSPASFTPGVRSVTPSSNRLSPRVVTAGSLTVDSVAGYASGFAEAPVYYDNQRDEACIPAYASDSTLRCLPIPVDDISSMANVFSVAFADPGCSMTIAVATAVGCNLPKYAFDVIQNCGLPSTTAVRTLGAPITGSTVYVESGGTCTAAPLPPGYSAYNLGAEILPSMFVSIQESVH